MKPDIAKPDLADFPGAAPAEAAPLRHGASSACRAVNRTMSIVSGRWVGLVVHELSKRPARFSELRRAIGAVTQKSLTSTLRELEAAGLVTREVTPVIPPRVDYTLTPLGHTLHPHMEALRQWAIEHELELSQAQHAYQQRQEEGA